MRARGHTHRDACAGTVHGQRGRNKGPFDFTIGCGHRLHARGGKKQVVTTTRVNAVIEQRFAVGAERHTEHHAVQMAGKQIQRVKAWPFGKPNRINNLRQRLITEVTMTCKHNTVVHHRLGMINRQGASRRPMQPADAIVSSARLDFKHRCKCTHQRGTFFVAEYRHTQRVVAGTAYHCRNPLARHCRHIGHIGQCITHQRLCRRASLRHFAKILHRFAFPSRNAHGKRHAREAIQSSDPLPCHVTVRHLCARVEQSQTLRRRQILRLIVCPERVRALRGVVEQRCTFAAFQCPNIRFAQVVNFSASRLTIQRLQARYPEFMRLRVATRHVTQLRVVTIDPQIRKAGDAMRLCVSHPRVINRCIQRTESFSTLTYGSLLR